MKMRSASFQFCATGKEDEPETIELRNRGLFDSAVQDDRLLAEESIFSDEVGFASCEICDSAENNRVAGGLSEVQVGSFKKSDETAEQSSQPE